MQICFLSFNCNASFVSIIPYSESCVGTVFAIALFVILSFVSCQSSPVLECKSTERNATQIYSDTYNVRCEGYEKDDTCTAQAGCTAICTTCFCDGHLVNGLGDAHVLHGNGMLNHQFHEVYLNDEDLLHEGGRTHKNPPRGMHK